MATAGAELLQAGYPSCCQTNNIKATWQHVNILLK